MSSKKTSFLDDVLAELTKDEAQVQKETVEDTIEDYIIQCNAQIGYYNTGQIPGLKLQAKTAERKLKAAEKNLANVYLKLQPANFEGYLESIASAESLVEKEQLISDAIANSITELETQVKMFESLLKRLEE